MTDPINWNRIWRACLINIYCLLPASSSNVKKPRGLPDPKTSLSKSRKRVAFWTEIWDHWQKKKKWNAARCCEVCSFCLSKKERKRKKEIQQSMPVLFQINHVSILPAGWLPCPPLLGLSQNWPWASLTLGAGPCNRNCQAPPAPSSGQGLAPIP